MANRLSKSQGVKHLLFIFLLSLGCYSSFAQRPEVVVTTGHSNMVAALSVSPDGRFLASGDNDKMIKIWELDNGREFRTFSGNDGRVNKVHFTADSKHITALLNDGSVRAWNVITGEETFFSEADESSEALSYCARTGQLAFVDEDQHVRLTDLSAGSTPIDLELDYPARIALSPDGGKLFLLNHKGTLRTYQMPGGGEINQAQLWDEPRFAVTNIAVSQNTNYLAIAFAEDKYRIRIYDANSLSEIAVFEGHKNRISALKFDPSGEFLISADMVKAVKCWDIAKQKTSWEETAYTYYYSDIAFLPDGRSFVASEMKEIHLRKLRNGRELRNFDAIGNSIVNMAYDPTDRFVAIATDNLTIKLWELRQNRIASTIGGFFPIAFSPDGGFLVSTLNAMSLAVWDPYSGTKMYTLPTEMELIQNLCFSPDGKYLAGSGFLGVVKIWDLESQTIIKRLTGHDGGIYGIDFSPDGSRIVSGGLDQTIRLWDWQAETELAKAEGHTIIVSDVEFSPDGKTIASASWDKTLKLWNATDLTEIRTFEGHENMVMTCSFSADGTKLTSGAGNNTVSAADNTVRVWDVASGEEICTVGQHRDIVKTVNYGLGDKFIFSASDDGIAKIWDSEKCEEVVRMISVNQSDYVLVTPDHYYTASKDALNGVSFRVKDQLFPFDQFDLKLNRPDIVAQRIGKAPPALIDAYHRAYLRRLRKMKFTEEMLGEDFHLPQAKILTTELPVSTNASELQFEAEFWDDRFSLDRVNVFVNDVPVYGVEGIPLREATSTRTTLTINAPLIPGPNKVQVSVLNEKGAESLRQTHLVILEENEAQKGDLHIIAVGVSDYQESRFKLDFAAKDARDFIHLLEGSSELYKEVHVKEITDSMATVENILALEDYLTATAPEDVVVIFFAGHGMLSKDMEYFFGTYDIAFGNPLERGLSYTKIEKLFNKTRALRKLLIMDTCHSGEVEDDDLDVGGGDEDGKRNVTTKTFDTRGAPGSAAVGLYNSFDLMQSLFSDIRRGTGATVISSAGGAEYAYESTEWSNGLFTFCMLDGLSRGVADLNRDGVIHISELRGYVNQRVSDLSDGKQNPTYRNENLSMDFVIWKR